MPNWLTRVKPLTRHRQAGSPACRTSLTRLDVHANVVKCGAWRVEQRHRRNKKCTDQPETICVSSAPSSPVLVAYSNKETSATAKQSILAVKKMPLLGLTPACLAPSEDYDCVRGPALLSNLTAHPPAPNNMAVKNKNLPDCTAPVENLPRPPQQPPPPSVLEFEATARQHLTLSLLQCARTHNNMPQSAAVAPPPPPGRYRTVPIRASRGKI